LLHNKEVTVKKQKTDKIVIWLKLFQLYKGQFRNNTLRRNETV